MKKILFILTIALFSGTSLLAQGARFNYIFDKYKHEPEVVNVYVPGFLMKLAANIADDDLSREEENLLRSIKSIKVLTVENDWLNKELNFVEEFRARPLNDQYVSMLEVKDDGSDVMILARLKNERMRDLMIIVGGEENVLVRIRGRMDVDLMESLQAVTGIDQAVYAQEITIEK